MKSYDDDELIKFLYIVSAFNPGNARIHKLKEYFGSWDELYRELAFRKPRGIFTEKELAGAKNVHGDQLRGIISYCRQRGIAIICYNDEEYPQRLRNINNPPAVIFCRGDYRILKDDVIVAVVGSRKPSDYTKKATAAVAGTFAASGITVASGFAAGTDITAHLSAVENGGKTIAVFGSGVDYIYPKENAVYVDKILGNGAIISEYFPQAVANTFYFTARNRILAGISQGTVVMEARSRSGSLNTASHTISNGRDLWVMPPHDIFDSRYDGGKKLLAEGAVPLYSPNDVPNEYFENHTCKTVNNSVIDSAVIDDDILETALININNGGTKKKSSTEKPKNKRSAKTVKEENGGGTKSTARNEARNVPSGPPASAMLTGDHLLIYNILKESAYPLNADDISSSTGLGVSVVFTVLLELEVDGLLASDSAQNYTLV